MKRLEQSAIQKKFKIAAVVANCTPSPTNGRQVILTTLVVVFAAGAVWQMA